MSHLNYEEQKKEDLKKYTARLNDFLAVNAEKTLIATEVGLIFQAALGYCGPQVFTKLGTAIGNLQRTKAGVCMGFENPCNNPVAWPIELCEDCNRKMDVMINNVMKNLDEENSELSSISDANDFIA